MEKTRFYVYCDWFSGLMDDFTDEEVGKMLRALNRYIKGEGEEEFKDRALKKVWFAIKKTTDFNDKQYEKKSEWRKKIDEMKKACKELRVDSRGAVMVNENWIVSAEGDMIGRRSINGGFTYLISCDRLMEDDWCLHLITTKRGGIIYDFLEAYMVALRCAGIDEVTQRIGYGEDAEMITLKPKELANDLSALKNIGDKMISLCYK